jgi:adenylate cyclase
MPLSHQVQTGASQDRLERLIQERLKLDRKEVEAKAQIDRRIWNLFGERWAVMFTDLSGFSRLAADFGIIHFLQTICESHRILIPCIEEHGGILLKTEGDSLLVIFRSVDEAMGAAIDMQRLCKRYNMGRAPEDEMLLCVGLGYGDVLRIGDADVFGAEVNAASKLGEDTAQSWEILVTDSVMAACRRRDEVGFYAPIDAVPPGAKAAYRINYTF